MAAAKPTPAPPQNAFAAVIIIGTCTATEKSGGGDGARE